MTAKKPVHRELFEYRAERMRKQHPMMFKIAPIFNSECEMVVIAYHGSRLRAGLSLIKEYFRLGFSQRYFHLVFWFCDFIGWTKLVDIPETQTHHAYKMRHAKKCHGSPNCSQDCINSAVPKWFRKITRTDDL